MPKHETPEELEAKNAKLLGELEKPEDPIPEPEPIIESTPDPEPKPVVDPEPEPEPGVVPESVEEPDYKKKFSESSREAQKKVAANRVLNQAIDEANEVTEPTEEELQAEYEDWDLLDQTTKRLAKETLMSTKRFALISTARVAAKKIEKWDEDVNKFVEDPQNLIDNPELEGKIDEFKIYANEETRHSVPFDVLVPAFLHQTKTAKSKSKGAMFPDGSGGPNDNPKPKGDKISVAESEILRQTNYTLYKEKLTQGKIDNSTF